MGIPAQSLGDRLIRQAFDVGSSIQNRRALLGEDPGAAPGERGLAASGLAADEEHAAPPAGRVPPGRDQRTKRLRSPGERKVRTRLVGEVPGGRPAHISQIGRAGRLPAEQLEVQRLGLRRG